VYALISNDSFFYLFVINGGVFLFHGKVVYIYGYDDKSRWVCYQVFAKYVLKM